MQYKIFKIWFKNIFFGKNLSNKLIINSTVYLPFVGKQYSPTVLDPFAGALGTYKRIQWFNSNFDCNIQFVGYDLSTGLMLGKICS